MMWYFVNIVAILAAFAESSTNKRSNIVLVVTDDQDLILGGLTPLAKTQKLIANKGITFTNAFATTPICCPSRASILSGLYQHNHRTFNNSDTGGCSGSHWQENIEPFMWPVQLHDAGYTTFYAGKYLNQYGTKRTVGVKHIPNGWDWWIGLVGNSRYYNYSLSVNGTAVFHEDDYLTDLIRDYAVQFLQQKHLAETNFLMVLATPAPHAPFTPAPQYVNHYRNVTAARTPNFNTPVHNDKHWLVGMSPSPLPESFFPMLDAVYRQRWETLLSVDDMVEAVISQLNERNLLENTYVILTSDHGYHVGQFGLPWDKRQPYETDIRIPLLIRGPGVPEKKISNRPILNIDFAPTFLELAGLNIPSLIDGVSFASLLQNFTETETEGDRTFLIEYKGEGHDGSVSTDCHYPRDNSLDECSPATLCKCQDSRNNTFMCVRHIGSENIIFCKFKDSHNFTEVYDLNSDPYELHNLSPYLRAELLDKYTSWLNHLMWCSGDSCNSTG